MHEVGIAQSILEIVEKEAAKNNATVVKKVKLIVGEFTGIVKEALEFALEIVKKNTIAENAEFEIEIVKLKTHCKHCNREFTNNKQAGFLCPECNGILSIVAGKELNIEYIDVD